MNTSGSSKYLAILDRLIAKNYAKEKSNHTPIIIASKSYLMYTCTYIDEGVLRNFVATQFNTTLWSLLYHASNWWVKAECLQQYLPAYKKIANITVLAVWYYFSEMYYTLLNKARMCTVSSLHLVDY